MIAVRCGVLLVITIVIAVIVITVIIISAIAITSALAKTYILFLEEKGLSGV